MVLISYAPVVRAGFVWDDDADILENAHLLDVGGLARIWQEPGATRNYYPLFYTALWVQHHLWEDRPLGYHLVNVALHAAGALLFWALLRKLRVGGAWLAAAIFATHPVFVESVAWADELKNVQSGVLYLLCLLAYFRARPVWQDDEACRSPRVLYGLALVAFAAALLTKPAAVFLPFVMLAIVWWRRPRVSVSDAVAIAPMVGMGMVFGLITMYVEATYSGASGASWEMPVLDRLLVAGRALWFYAGKLLWPWPLMSIYPRWDIDRHALTQYLYPGAAAAAVGALWALRPRIGRGPLVAAMSFVALLAPTLGVFNVGYHLYSFVADHFQYHAAPALLALVGAGVASVRRRYDEPGRQRTVDAVCVALLAVLAGSSMQHARTFQSEKARCEDTLRKNPSAWLAMNNLGVALAAEGRLEDAVEQYRRALEVRPIYAEAHSNLGVALVKLGRVAEAISHYREALRIWPAYATARKNLGTALMKAGDSGAAIEQYRLALSLRPDDAETHNNLAIALASTGRAEEAVVHHREALRINPRYAQAQQDLGVTLLAAGRSGETVEVYRRAVQEQPRDASARRQLGAALASAGDTAGATREFEEALRLRPDYPQAHNALGLIRASRGDLPGAIASFEAALRSDPDSAEAHNNLGSALASVGSDEQAISQLREALRLKPGYAAAHKNLGMVLAAGGRFDEGLYHLGEATRLEPDNADAHSLIGALLAERGRLDEAIRHFQQVVALRPEDPRARADLDRARQMRRR